MWFLSFFLLLLSNPVFAQIDTSGVSSSISEGVSAVTSIIAALLTAYGAFLGLRMVVRELKGESGFSVENLSEEELDELWENSIPYDEYMELKAVVDEYWSSEESQHMDIYQFCELKGYDSSNIDDADWL